MMRDEACPVAPCPRPRSGSSRYDLGLLSAEGSVRCAAVMIVMGRSPSEVMSRDLSSKAGEHVEALGVQRRVKRMTVQPASYAGTEHTVAGHVVGLASRSINPACPRRRTSARM